MKFYEVFRSHLEPAGKTRDEKTGDLVPVYAARLELVGAVPGRSTKDALGIAKGLGHFCPIIGGEVQLKGDTK